MNNIKMKVYSKEDFWKEVEKVDIKGFDILSYEFKRQKRKNERYLVLYVNNTLVGVIRLFDYTFPNGKVLCYKNTPVKMLSFIDIHKKARNKGLSKIFLKETSDYLNRYYKNSIIISTYETELGEKSNILDCMEKQINNKFYKTLSRLSESELRPYLIEK